MPRESQADRTRRARAINRGLIRLYPEATCALDHNDPLQLLISTILSAQCTDVRVNMVTPALFACYPTAGAFADADPEDVETMIHTCGFFRQKTRSIIGSARRIVGDHGGRVPDTMEQLIELPGVARKTANIVLGDGYGKAEGIAVDTHVRRLSLRMKLSRYDDPVKIERDLMDLLPRKQWTDFSHRMIFHGRQVCNARKPDCLRCKIAKHCPSYDKLRPAD